MKNVCTFLAEVAESRRAAQASERSAFVPPSGLVLPEELEVALKHRFLLSPILARSRLAASSARVGVSSCERAQIEYWFARHRDDANWILETGEESGVVSLEIDPGLARQSLAYLAGDDPSWLRSLRFATGSRWHVLFQYVSGLPQFRAYPGLCLHAGGSILAPPSRTPSGFKLVYEDPHAPLLSIDWLRTREH